MKKHVLAVIELTPAIIAAILPLFVSLSYQINLYLTWEGAYRLYEGQIPYRDFGIPMGYTYWILPTIFFHLFGPYLFTLAKAQAFTHLISAVSFRWILLQVGTSFRVRVVSLLIFALTYILGLIWPQYNHSVIVFQFLAMGFILQYILGSPSKYQWLSLVGGCFFLVYSFLIKQDGGGLGILLATALIAYYSLEQRSFKPLLLYSFIFILFLCVGILPFIQHGFGYWFNYGQPPHYSRISLADFLRIIFTESRWEKFYLLTILTIFAVRWHKQLIVSREEKYFTLLVIGILIQALIFQVTSYVPLDNNFFFHAFSAAYLLYQIDKMKVFNYRFALPVAIVFVLVWWSEKYWKYVTRITDKFLATSETEGNVVSINTYILGDESCGKYVDMSDWVTTSVKSFQHVRMPSSTAEGITWFLDFIKEFDDPVVLNMSELTPLAHEAPFLVEKGVPLWYHLNVGMFEKELKMYKSRIEIGYYDVVLYEHLPQLNNFYPLVLREYLQKHYILVKSFQAPRSAYPGLIEIYYRPASGS